MLDGRAGNLKYGTFLQLQSLLLLLLLFLLNVVFVVVAEGRTYATLNMNKTEEIEDQQSGRMHCRKTIACNIGMAKMLQKWEWTQERC